MLSKLWQKFFVLTLLCGVFFVSSIASAGTLRVVYPANGLYSLQPKCAPNRELTVQDASVANGANVILWSINSNWHTQPSHQKWRITRLGNSQWYKIEAENSGKALNVHNGISQNGTNVTIWPYGGRMHQYRFLDAGGGYYAIQPNINGNFVLDVNSGANADGANVHVWQWNGSPAQLWKLVARTPKSPVNPIVKPVSRPTSTVAGDANGDGRFDQADKELATDYMLRTISSLPCQKNADVNGDGKIDLSDVSLMGMRLNGLIQQFPIEEKATPTPTPQPKTAWINTQSQKLNLRADAGQNYGIIGKLAKGTQVTVLEELSNGWSKISSSAGTGYVSSQYLTFVKPVRQEFAFPLHGTNFTITGANKYFGSGKKHSSKWYLSDGRGCAIDIGVNYKNVYAPGNGVVETVKDLGRESFGRYIIILHDNGKRSLVAHLSEFKVSEGIRVNTGDLIGVSGNTGHSTGPHLHFELEGIYTYDYFKNKGLY